MDVRLPDGTIIKNVPDGTTKADLVTKLQRNGMAVPADWLNASKPAAQPQPPIDPTEGMNTGEKLLAGVGQGMTDLYYGVGQRLGKIDQATIDEKKRLDAPLKKTTAGAVGGVGGRVALGLPAVLIPGANTLVGAGVIGSIQGAAEPTSQDESVLKNMLIGGASGTAGVALGRLLRAGYQGAKGLIEPFTEAGQNRIAGRTLERFATDPSALRGATNAATATGARPTLAEATRDTGIASLERSLAQQDPQVAAMLAQRAGENNAARVATIGSIAGDPAKRSAAEAARSAASGDMYQAATNATYTVDGKLADLLKRPAVQQAVNRAEQLAANQGRKFSLYANPDPVPYIPASPYPVTAKGVMAEEARRMAIEAGNTNAFSGVGGVKLTPVKKLTGQGLQDLKMAMDEMLSDPASGFTGKAGDTIKNLRSQVVQWMEDANPAFKQARTTYAAASKPINAMDVGQRLLDKTTGAIRDMGGNQRLQANAFSRALNDEAGTVQKATGFKGVNALADVMTPDQLSKLNAVRNELELVSNLSQAANGPGSQTAKSLASQNLLRQALGPTGLPQSWAESTMLETLLRPVQFGMKAAEPRIQNKLAQIMLDPSLARNALTAAEVKQLAPALERLMPLLQQAGQQSIPASSFVAGQR